ncbi:hypothetical protein ARALYDRAFT_918797 [Arabidopsis lyrata subsp. lyrata]|uniref:Uncharacterized protein n=1 Tax=Arabidopsis lyrata subsp. lyrata TaxID=81972 RepID=D7MLS0_ARALL|nr:hypothetical protein ARALYDRAFT_918797 [Arabidopsis lyrata subsp. lyrata]
MGEGESSASSDAILKASAATEAVEKIYQGQTISPITFQTKFRSHLVLALDQVSVSKIEFFFDFDEHEDSVNQFTLYHDHLVYCSTNLDADGLKLIPLISSDIEFTLFHRFDGIAPEPLKGNTKCVPFPQMFDSSQTMLPAEELKKRFEQEDLVQSTEKQKQQPDGEVSVLLILLIV